MTPQNLQTLLDFFKALSNESRLKLLGVLAQRECSVEELAALLHLKASTISHHLTKLKEHGPSQPQSAGQYTPLSPQFRTTGIP